MGTFRAIGRMATEHEENEEEMMSKSGEKAFQAEEMVRAKVLGQEYA